MENRRYQFTSQNWLFLIACLSTYLLGTLFSRKIGRDFNLISFLGGLIVFVAVYFLQRVLIYLYQSGVNPFSTVGFSKKFRKPKTLSELFIIYLSIFLGLYALLNQQVLVGINSFWITVIVLLVLFPTSRMGRLLRVPFLWILEAILVSPIMLIFGTTTQEGEIFQQTIYISLTIFFTYCASTVTLQFESFEHGLKEKSQSLLTSIGWGKTIQLHNIFIILMYLSLAMYIFTSHTWSIYRTLFLVIPISLFEMYQLYRIGKGLKPFWKIVRLTAIAHFFSLIYLLLFRLIIS